jgi:hypothetical protein
MFLNELVDALTDFIAGAAYKRPVLVTIICDCRVFNRPFQPPEGTRENGTRPFRIAFAERDKIGNSLAHEWVNTLGLLLRDINSYLQHCEYRIRIEGCRPFPAGTKRLKPIASHISQEGFRHLRATGIARAEKQHFRPNH